MKLYVIAGIIVVVIAFLSGGYYAGYKAGHNACNTKNQKAILEYKEKEAELLLQLENSKKKRRIIYRDKVKTVEKATDTCLDTLIPSGIAGLFDNQPR